jgi:hypothetical protein
MKDMRIMMELCASGKYTVPDSSNILENLFGNLVELEGFTERLPDHAKFYDQAESFKQDFPHSWLKLYEIARVVRDRRIENEWRILLGFLSVETENKAVSLEHLQILQTIAVNPTEFQNKDLPVYASYHHTGKYSFQPTEVRAMIRSCDIGFGKYFETHKGEKCGYEDAKEFRQKLKTRYELLKDGEVERMTNHVAGLQFTPDCGSIPGYYTAIKVTEAVAGVNKLLSSWYANLQLRNFVLDVQNTINSLQPGSTTISIIPFDFGVAEAIMSQSTDEYRKRSCPKLYIGLTEAIQAESESVQKNILKEAREIYKTESWSKKKVENQNCIETEPPRKVLKLSPETFYQKKADALLECAKDAIFHQNKKYPYKEELEACGLFPRLVPRTLLPLLCSPTLQIQINPILDCIGAMVVLWTLEQKELRCSRFARAGISGQFALKREKESPAHSNWTPATHPEWLLLELELEINIRPTQVRVAEQMLNPPDGKSSLM